MSTRCICTLPPPRGNRSRPGRALSQCKQGASPVRNPDYSQICRFVFEDRPQPSLRLPLRTTTTSTVPKASTFLCKQFSLTWALPRGRQTVDVVVEVDIDADLDGFFGAYQK